MQLLQSQSMVNWQEDKASYLVSCFCPHDDMIIKEAPCIFTKNDTHMYDNSLNYFQ